MTTPAPTPAVPKVVKDGEWSSGILDIAQDPVTCLLGYCLPCVLHGMIAERAHGPVGSMPTHCLQYYFYSCVCLCGLIAGPTRSQIRRKYKLPIQPGCLEGQGMNADCIANSIPCLACFTLCQTARELNTRNPKEVIAPRDPFSWSPPANPPAEEMVMTK